MSIASVLIAARSRTARRRSASGPRYTLLLSTDPALIEAAQRLRHEVFTTEPGFALRRRRAGGRDADRFDEYCDHLLVREDDTGELVGCYRMLPPPERSRPAGCTPQPNSTSPRSTRYGRRWWRWAAPWCATATATAAWCC